MTYFDQSLIIGVVGNFLNSFLDFSAASSTTEDSFILGKFLNLAADSLFLQLPPLIDYWSSFCDAVAGGSHFSLPERSVIKRWGGGGVRGGEGGRGGYGGGRRRRVEEGEGGFATHRQLWSSSRGRLEDSPGMEDVWILVPPELLQKEPKKVSRVGTCMGI